MVFIFVNVHPPPLTLGCKNKKRPFGPIELDLEAGNLVSSINEYQSTTLDKSQFNVLFKAPYQLRIL